MPNPKPALPLTSSAKLPTGPTVAEELDKMYRRAGLTPPSAVDISEIPPWTEEEADAFERAVNGVCERIDDVSKLP